MNILSEHGLPDYLRCHSYFSKRHRLLYVSTPKVASTSLKWWFASLEGYGQVLRASNETEESDLELSIHENFQKVAPHVMGLNLEGLLEALTSDAYFRFAVVRNPYERIFSAWQSKLLLREPLQDTSYVQSEFFHHPIERESDILAAFEGFLEHLASNEAPSFWDPHWTPQASLLRPELISYSKLTQIENAGELREALGEWLEGWVPNPFAMRTNESLIPYLPDFISKRSAELIRTLYANDFDVFGYSMQIPSAAENFTAVQLDLAIKAIKLVRARHERLGERANQVKALKRAITDRDAEIAGLGAAIAQRDAEAGRLKGIMAEREAEVAGLGAVVAQQDQEIGSLKRRVAEQDAEVRQVARTMIERGHEVETMQRELTRVLRSGSWRATAPFRGAAALAGRVLGRKPSKYPEASRDHVHKSALHQIRASKLFDADYYLAANPDVRRSGIDPAIHYLIHGWKESRNPSMAFNTAAYLTANPDVVAARVNPLLHYLASERVSRPIKEAAPDPTQIATEVKDIRKSGLFDESFYLSMYRDLEPAPDDPIRHYCERGWREGRNPSDDFDTQFYLKSYGDIRNAGVNPFWHFVCWGAAESRASLPQMSSRYEDDIRFGLIETDVKLLAFYASPNWESLRRGQPRFKGHVQPILPSTEIGAYDPCDWQTLKQQAQLATRHGVHGFCFDLNVAPDAMIEAQPLGQLIAHAEIGIRFCVQLTITADFPVQRVAEGLARIFADRRQIRVDGRPVLLVKVGDDREGASAFQAQLRRQFRKPEEAPFIIGRSSEWSDQGATLANFCDAVLDLPSNPVPGETGECRLVKKNSIDTIPYGLVAASGIARIAQAKHSKYSVYHAVTLARDTTAQDPLNPVVYTRFLVGEYRRWLDAAIANTKASHQNDRRFLFINAWNDWNQGLQLEPDSATGFSRLNETTRALLDLESGLRMPRVSVIVPNYNHEPFLRRRLDSIYGQTYKNIEVILLDDCSSDESRSILDAYSIKYGEITSTIYNDHNSGGPFRQWAKGIKEARGELVWIAESDDYCDERFLEELVRCFEDEAVLLAYGRSVFVDSKETNIDDKAFDIYVQDLGLGDKWRKPYTETAHNEVVGALGVKNTIPNVSSVVFKRPIDMGLLDDESWHSMRVAGDWIFYLHLLRGGKIAYRPAAVNFFRRYKGSTAERTYKSETFYREVGLASRTVAALYDAPWKTLERCRDGFEAVYFWHFPAGRSDEFARWYDYEAIARARGARTPNIMVTTMGFYPGGAEILPIRIANELKRQGHSVLLFSAGLLPWQDGVRRMVRNDVPVVESSDVEAVRAVISDFGVQALNTHQWHMQKYPLQLPDVYDRLFAHVASLHGMIEHGDAFEATEEQLRGADRKVTTWAYTADKNIGPFFKFGLCDKSSGRFVKIANGMQPPEIMPVPRAQMNIPEDAFVLCCVSRAIVDKGWAETIEAVDTARKLSGRDIRLILVGNGPVYEEYCKAGAPEFVHLAGFSENSVGYYAAADMGIMLTKFKSESFPLTIVDCLFAGKPYIASDIGEIRNMLTAGDAIAGSVIELNDWEVPVEAAAREIAAFASDRLKYSSASGLVEAAARRFRIDEVVAQYVRLFEAERTSPRIADR